MLDFLIHAEAQTRVYSDLPTTTNGFSVGGIDAFYAVLSNFNYFALAFSIFYSVILYMNFWYWRLFHHRERLHHEAKGVKAIQDAWWIWGRYLITLILLQLALVSALSIARTIFIFLYLVVLLVWKLREDIIVIAESLSQGFGQIGWSNDWPKKLAENIKGLRLSEMRKMPKDKTKKKFEIGEYEEIEKEENGKTMKVKRLVKLYFSTILISLFGIFVIISVFGLTIWSLLV
jgi:hypothetical protein